MNPSRKISARQYFPRTVASDSLISVQCQLFTRPFAPLACDVLCDEREPKTSLEGTTEIVRTVTHFKMILTVMALQCINYFLVSCKNGKTVHAKSECACGNLMPGPWENAFAEVICL